MGVSVKGFARTGGYRGRAGSAKDACGLRFLCPGSPHFGMQMTGPSSCGSPAESWEALPSCLAGVDHP